jgi:TP901 family phage tail tape measure protein
MARSRIAEAYVQIVPMVDGFGGKIKSDLNKQLGQAGADGGSALAKSTGTGFASKIKGALGPAIGIIGSTFAAVKIGGFLKDAITEATDLKTALTEVVTLTGASGSLAAKDFGLFQSTVKDVSNEFGIAQDVLTNGLYNAISAGVPKDNALTFLQVASKASIAGVTDVNTAVDGLSTVINAFGLSAEDAQAVADSMFTAVKGGKTTFGELSGSMFQVGPAAAAAGVSFKEVNAAVATLTAAGTPTSVATTQIKSALVALQRPTENMTKLFNDLGYESAQSAIEQEGLQFALGAVTDYADGNNGKMIELLGSIEAVSAVQVLAGTGAEKFTSELEAQGEAAGSTQTAFDELDATRSAERNKIAFENLTLSIGNALLPVAILLTDFLKDSFVPFMENTLVPAFETVSAYITDVVVPAFQAISGWVTDNIPTILTFIGVLGSLLIAFNYVRIATTLWSIAQGILNTIMALNVFTLVAIAVAALIAGIVYLATSTTFFQDTWKVMTEFVSKAWEGFKDLFVKVVEAITDFFKTLVGNLKESWETMTENLGKVWEKFTGFISGIWDGFKEGFDNVVNGFKTIFEKVFNGIGDFFKGIVNGYISMFESFINFVISGANGLIRALNRIQINIPSTPFSQGFSIGVNLPSLDKLNIPRLAEGGYVDQPTTALIGEAGPEVVVPLDRFEAMVGLDGGAGKTVNYYAAPNNSIDSEQALFQAMRRAKVVAAW